MGNSNIASEKYLSFTTFRKDGTPKSTPVWIADLGDGTIGFTSASSSWKVKRLANNSSVLIQPSDSRGKVKGGTEPVSATAVASKEDFSRVASTVEKKYGLQFKAIMLLGNFMKLIGRGSGTDTAIIVTPL